MGIFRKVVKTSAVATLILGGGAGVVYRRRLQENASCTAVEFNARQDQAEVQKALASLEQFAKSGGKAAPVGIKLYRYTTCPFCSKVKAFLECNNVPHECVEVEPMFKSQLGTAQYRKVPQLEFTTSGPEQAGPRLVDSDIIVDTLAKTFGRQEQLSDEDVVKWRGWARDRLVRLLVVNINESLIEAWKGYEYIDQFDSIPTTNKIFLKVMGAPVMWLVAKYMTMPNLLRSGALKPGDDPRLVLHEEINRFVADALPPPADEKVFTKKTAGKDAPKYGAKNERGPFHGGAQPDVADLDVYGVLQSVRGHRIYNDFLKSTTVGPWLSKMDATCGNK